MHQVQPTTHRKCSVTALFNYLYARHHRELYHPYRRYGTVSATCRRRRTCPRSWNLRCWAWTGMKVQRRMKTTANQSVWTYQIYRPTWPKGKPTSLTLQKKSWQQSVTPRSSGWNTCHINEYLGMSEEEKELYRRTRSGRWFQRFVYVNEHVVSTNGMIWSKAISSLKVVEAGARKRTKTSLALVTVYKS